MCIKAGSDLRSSLGLAGSTLAFHIANAFSIKLRGNRDLPKRYSVKLEHNPFELWLRTYCGDLFVFHEVFLDGCYRLPRVDIGNVDTVIDLGANIGLTTLYFSQFIPEAKYVCVEPNSENFELLKRNVLQLGERIKIVEGAIGRYSGKIEFNPTKWSWGGHVSRDQNSGSIVRCVTMEEIINDYDLNSIDILKVDIEGAESDLFGNNNEWLRNVKLIIVELHGKYTIREFVSDVGKFGFVVLPQGSKYGNSMTCAVSPELQATLET